MNVPISWLKEYIDVPLDPQLLADKFTYIGYMLDRPVQKVGDDIVLDLEVRQNRSDCLSIIGLARELGAVLDKDIVLPPVQDLSSIPSTGETKIQIVDPQLCYRFNTLTIRNIEIKPSPKWLTDRLEAYGIKSINNIVDITNYVMVEFGIPMHAFDAQKVTDKTIIIRPAQDGESLVMFGGRKVTFTSDDLILADPDGPITTSLMGGEEKSIHPDTTEIILEAAVYNQANVRRSSLRQEVRTESSTRLEKFLHPHGTELALARALKLITDIVGGEVIDHTDAYPNPLPEKQVELEVTHIKHVTGVDISKSEAEKILNKLEIKTNPTHGDTLLCTLPYFRTDLEQEIDLIEEVIRIYGYDRIEEKPLVGAIPKDIQPTLYTLEDRARDILVGLGYDEQITEPPTHEQNPTKTPVLLENSLTSEKTMLRTTLEFSLLNSLTERKKHRQNDIQLFEVGKIYFKDGDSYREEHHIGGIAFNEKGIDFQQIKGHMEALLYRLGYEYDDSYAHLKYVDALTVYFDINTELLIQNSPTEQEVIFTAPQQNVIREDFSITSKPGISGAIIQEISKADPLILGFKIIQGPTQLENNLVNIVGTVSFYSAEMPLSKKDIQPVREKIESIIAKALED